MSPRISLFAIRTASGGLPAIRSASARARAVAERIAAKPPEAVRIAKKLIRGDTVEIEQRYLHEGDLFAERLRSPEAAEAFQAFFEKRAPVFP